jgi:hypothetical protein
MAERFYRLHYTLFGEANLPKSGRNHNGEDQL